MCFMSPLDIVQHITKYKLLGFSHRDTIRHICKPTGWPSRQTSYLYGHVARWIVKYQHWLTIELNQDFLIISNEKIERLPQLTLPGYI